MSEIHGVVKRPDPKDLSTIVCAPSSSHKEDSNSCPSRSVAKFIVPDLGDKVDSGIGLSYRPAYIALPAGTATLCRSQLYPPIRDYEFGYYETGYWMLVLVSWQASLQNIQFYPYYLLLNPLLNLYTKGSRIKFCLGSMHHIAHS